MMKDCTIHYSTDLRDCTIEWTLERENYAEEIRETAYINTIQLNNYVEIDVRGALCSDDEIFNGCYIIEYIKEDSAYARRLHKYPESFEKSLARKLVEQFKEHLAEVLNFAQRDEDEDDEDNEGWF